MSVEKLQKDIALIAASLEALAANVKANTADQKRMAEDQKRMADDLDRMAQRGRLMDEELQNLQGTFASIGEHLVRLFERDAETRAWRERVEARLEALEKRQPPAA